MGLSLSLSPSSALSLSLSLSLSPAWSSLLCHYRRDIGFATFWFAHLLTTVLLLLARIRLSLLLSLLPSPA